MQPQHPADSVDNRLLAPVYHVDDLVVDVGRVTVTRDGHVLPMPKLSFDLLVALIEGAPRVLSPDELMDRVWPGLVVGLETISQRVKLLRDSLGDDPKSPRYIAGVRGRGYRLQPDVIRLATAGQPDAATGPLAVPAHRARWQVFLPLVMVGIAIVAGSWFFLDRTREATPARDVLSSEPLPAHSVAVLAFENRGGAPGTEILAEGIPETVLHQLARLPGLTVIARGSSFAFRDHPEDLRVIGRRLNVRYLLEGSVQTAGSRLRVTSSLVDVQNGASVWSMQFDRAPSDVFAVQDEIALEVARAMQLTVDAGVDAAASLRLGATRSYEAYLAFLRGRALLANSRVADIAPAIQSLSAAIRHDPDFSAAYVLLARAQVAFAEVNRESGSKQDFDRAVERAMAMLDKAIALDPKSGEAYVERGYLKAFDDLAAADSDLRKGLELSPNYARGYEGLAAVMFQSVARRREALDLVEKARRLDPLASHLDVLKATYLLWGPGDMSQSAQLLEAVLDRDPLYVPAMLRLAEVRWAGQGEFAESIQLLEQAISLDPDNESAWRQLVTSYLDVDDPAAAASAARHLLEDPASVELSLHVYRREWREAGEAAYRLIANDASYPQIELRVALAVRSHARLTGDYPRAIKALEKWAAVTWDDVEPVWQGQLDIGMGVAGLADMLAASGQRTRPAALLEELLAETATQVDQYGRGAVWVNGGRAVALAMLNRPNEAIATLQEQMRLDFGKHDWRLLFVDEPAFDALRSRKDFQALLAEARGNAAREHKQLQQMRADGLVPARE